MLIINYCDNYPIQQHFRRNDKVVHEDRIIGYLSAVLNKKSYSYIWYVVLDQGFSRYLVNTEELYKFVDFFLLAIDPCFP
jgi:hypothetical protein